MLCIARLPYLRVHWCCYLTCGCIGAASGTILGGTLVYGAEG
ncbi:hypothetical protein HMPREF9248_0606 [Fannyhessea vaginae PB189-T1-4]|uniref:Uncharacterized protein n=1 Tax=Fannyhessea vaginae PB189-T1-4 TaxID=866774 RepID=A0ABN0AZ84_9ACTN|nr:hypothetical protein HMPREF9248_0606 [Fannyhessea vaginae PB189-T1-4]